MIIKVKNYKLIQREEKGFDLIKEVDAQKLGTGTMQSPNGEKYLRDEEIGYNMSLENCIQTIIHLELCKSNETVDLKTYIDEYKRVKNEITNILK